MFDLENSVEVTQVLILIMHNAPTSISAAAALLKTIPWFAKPREAPPIMAIETREKILVLQLTQRWLSQRCIQGPKNLLPSSQLCHLSEDREKQAAASSIKGVVGSKGNTAPTAPSVINANPSSVYILIRHNPNVLMLLIT
nr:hypothetical protein [Zhongshania aquimaris]